jgi:hypothetical protein
MYGQKTRAGRRGGGGGDKVRVPPGYTGVVIERLIEGGRDEKALMVYGEKEKGRGIRN